MAKIDKMAPGSGRRLKEDDSVVNIADLIEKIASGVTLTGPDGTPISSASGKLDVRASELETLLTALGGKDFATQTTLAQILAKLSADPATETTLAGGIVSLLSAIAETASETTAAAILAKLEAGIDTTLTGSSLQYFNSAVDDYEVLQGRNGAQRVEIYGPDGNPLSTIENKLDVRASELETLLSALGAKDFATQTTLAAILVKLADPATQTTLAAILAKLEAGIDTTLTGSSLELYGKTIADRPAANTVAEGTTFTIIDANLDQNWISDGTNWLEV